MIEGNRLDDDNNLKGLMEHLTLKNKKKKAKNRCIKIEQDILSVVQESVNPEVDGGACINNTTQYSLMANGAEKLLIEAAILEGDEAAELQIYTNGSFNFVTCTDDADDEISRFLQNGNDENANVIAEVTINSESSASVAEANGAEQTVVQEATCNVHVDNETSQQQQLLEEAQAADLEDDDDIIILDDQPPSFFNDDSEVGGRLTIADENEVEDVKPNVVNVQNTEAAFPVVCDYVDETVELVDECLMDQTDQCVGKNASDNTFFSNDIALDERDCDFSKFTQFAASVSHALADIPVTVTERRHSMFGGNLEIPDSANSDAVVAPPDAAGVSHALYSSAEDEDGIIFLQHFVNNNGQQQQQHHSAPPIYQQTSSQKQNEQTKQVGGPDVIEISEDEYEARDNTTAAFYEHIPRSINRSFGRSRSCAPRSAHRARSQSRHHNQSRYKSRAGSRFPSRHQSPHHSNGGSSWYNNGRQSRCFTAAASTTNDTMINSSGIPIFRRRSGSRRASSCGRSKSCRREVPRAYQFCNREDSATNDDSTANNVLPIYERNRTLRRQYQERHRSMTRGFTDRARQGRSKSQAPTRYNSPSSVRRRYGDGRGSICYSRRRSPSPTVRPSVRRSEIRRRRSISKFKSPIRCNRSRSRSSISSTSTYSRYSSHRRHRSKRRSPSRCRSCRRRSRSLHRYRGRSRVPTVSPSTSSTSYYRGGGISSSDSSSRYRRAKSRTRRHHEETPPRSSRCRRSPSTHRRSRRESRDDSDTITLSKDHLFRLLQKVLENSGTDNTASRLANDFLQSKGQKPSNYFADVPSINASIGNAPQHQFFESANTVNNGSVVVDSLTNRKRPGDLNDDRSLKNSRFNAITAVSMIETYENVAGPSNGTMLWP